MNEEELKQYNERIESKKRELYNEYLFEKLDLIFVPRGCGVEADNYLRGLIWGDSITLSEDNEKYHEGYKIIEAKRGRTDYLSKTGKKLVGYDDYYDCDGIFCYEAHDFCEGKSLIINNRKRYRFVSMNGYHFMNDPEFLRNYTYDFARDYHEGFACVKRYSKFGFDGSYLGKEEPKWNYIDHDGKPVLEEWVDSVSDIYLGRAKIRKGLKIQILYLGLPGYEVTHLPIGGYVCTKQDKKIHLKYQPVKMYYDESVLCTDRKNYYMYDIKNDEYIKVGPVKSFVYDSNFLYDKDAKRVYFIYNHMLVDITDYYLKKLASHGYLSINRDIKIDNILTIDDFMFEKMETIDKIVKEEKEKNLQLLEKQRNEQKQKEIEDRTIEIEKKEEERRAIEKEGLNKLKEALQLLEESKKVGEIPRIQYHFEFEKVDDHLEIPSIILPVLKHIDLSLVIFRNVKLSGIDFSECNIKHFNPQEVYNKDLSNCNFEGLYIDAFMDFTGVDIRGSKFSYDNNGLTLDTFNSSFEKAIYDDTTLFNGIPLKEFLEKIKNQDPGAGPGQGMKY